ncbi:type II toxin-antitoxin system RelE/ParE family toxin [Desulfovibrionales bacterium]
MARFEILFKRSVAKDLRLIPNKDVQKIVSRISKLADDPLPAGSEKLTNQELYRIRQGMYRILYEIQEKRLVIIVVKIGHRRKIYKNR